MKGDLATLVVAVAVVAVVAVVAAVAGSAFRGTNAGLDSVVAGLKAGFGSVVAGLNAGFCAGALAAGLFGASFWIFACLATFGLDEN